MKEFLIQMIGVAGIVCSVLSFQCKKHGKILFFRTMNELLFGIQYICLGAYTGAAMNAVGCVRNTLFSAQVKRGKSTTLSRILFSVLFIAFSIVTWSGLKSLLVGVAKVVSTFAYGCRNTVLMRYMILLTSAAWLTYNLLAGSAAGVINEALNIVSILIALVRIARDRNLAEDNV